MKPKSTAGFAAAAQFAADNPTAAFSKAEFVSTYKQWRIQVRITPRGIRYQAETQHGALGHSCKTPRAAVLSVIAKRTYNYAGGWYMLRSGKQCTLHCYGESAPTFRYTKRPSRKQLAADIRASLPWWRLHSTVMRDAVMRRAADIPDIYGWRRWSLKDGVLYSPQMTTPWPDTVMQAHKYSVSTMVEGEAGIHAYHLPRNETKAASVQMHKDLLNGHQPDVCGVVERFGQCVVGTRGWRAEWARIVRLYAAPEHVDALRANYPEVEIIPVALALTPARAAAEKFWRAVRAVKEPKY